MGTEKENLYSYLCRMDRIRVVCKKMYKSELQKISKFRGNIGSDQIRKFTSEYWQANRLGGYLNVRSRVKKGHRYLIPS